MYQRRKHLSNLNNVPGKVTAMELVTAMVLVKELALVWHQGSFGKVQDQ
jgi:hypothetical protein